MSVYRPKNSPYWHYDFQLQGVRFHGSTGTTQKRSAEAIERQRRTEAAEGKIKRRKHISLNEACGRYFEETAQFQPSADTTDYQLENLVTGLGNELLQTGRQQQAMVQYRRVLEFAPDNLMALSNIGVVLFDRGRFDEAERHFLQAFAIEPNDAMVQANMGDIRRVRQRFDEALEHYRASLELRPDHASSHYWMGTIYMQRRDGERAIHHLQAALRIDPQLREAREALDLFGR